MEYQKFSGGWHSRIYASTAGYMVVVVCLIIVSTPGPDFAKVKARFGQVGDQVGPG